MEWVSLVMDHSGITIIFLLVCLLCFNFGSFIFLLLILAALYFGGSWLLGCI
ncbi:hypothetical protein [Pelosinus propionicus]|uniref:Uncharacterized protein n=1 Tax=Pelosinus propionicus DSM 13327 TaxID=1123291 RepID=A0A1I4MMZ1_9FIRM|nr:hypothetical protein [Pelosinus propionicus]SFM04395.1 hypothetical protein SAMN04490355_103540 [Pelosinus propionicus DSM 13327]